MGPRGNVDARDSKSRITLTMRRRRNLPRHVYFDNVHCFTKDTETECVTDVERF